MNIRQMFVPSVTKKKNIYAGHNLTTKLQVIIASKCFVAGFFFFPKPGDFTEMLIFL